MSRSVITIGVFDGVHLGHQAILQRARRLAARAGEPAKVVAVTFDRHPQGLLSPGSEPPRLLSTARKVSRLREAGVDEVIVHEPTMDLLHLTAEEFVADIVARHRPLAIVEGEDFRFGRGRRGDMALLRELGRRFGFEAVVEPKAPAVLDDRQEVVVSSSLVRWLVGHGRVREAATCLGRPFGLTARVVRGDRRGRAIGVPTANLEPDDYAPFILPADGVYAGVATVHPSPAARQGDVEKTLVRPAAISIGVKPTFAGRTLAVEAHLLDYTPPSPDDLYERTITLDFTYWVRDQYFFPGVESLKAQMARDLRTIRRLSPAAA